MTRRQRCSMPRRPGGLRWRRPLTVLLGLTVLLALDGSGILRVGLGCALLHESGLCGITGRNWRSRRSASACGCAGCL